MLRVEFEGMPASTSWHGGRHTLNDINDKGAYGQYTYNICCADVIRIRLTTGPQFFIKQSAH